MNLQPTMALRFVEREEESHLTADGRLLPHDVVRVIKRRVLQQYWTDTYGSGEWRDVPLGEETPNGGGNGRAD